ncbi:MAG: molybdenum cofactor guanylyltransferase [Bacteroidales bacterium]
MIPGISGVILAGGNSKRFNGILKAKIIIKGKTIISRIIETIEDIFDEIIIVTNIPEKFHEYTSCKIISDQFCNKGPLGGIHAALKESEREAIFVIAGDMPNPDRNLIVRQVNFYNNELCDVVIPQMDKFIEPLHGIYRKTITRNLEDYLSHDNDYAVREFFKRTNVHYMELTVSEKANNPFININSPSDVGQAV